MSSPPADITEWSQRAIRDMRHGDRWAKWVFELDRGQRLRSAVVEAAGALALVRAADLDVVSVMFFIPAGYPASDEEPFPTFDVESVRDRYGVDCRLVGVGSACHIRVTGPAGIGTTALHAADTRVVIRAAQRHCPVFDNTARHQHFELKPPIEQMYGFESRPGHRKAAGQRHIHLSALVPLVADGTRAAQDSSSRNQSTKVFRIVADTV